ncbi:MAG: phosphoglucosamine mutase [Eggerthellaceae bacterium]|nr:phosphoglucosamine mutase [Eggerthellaceae bacterium]
MGKYFGTDGFRGEANKDLTADHAYVIGQYLGFIAGNNGGLKAAASKEHNCSACNKLQTCPKAIDKFADAHPGVDITRPRILIGKDTRQSGDMYEHALAAGITAHGCDAYLVGVMTTPGVAYLTRNGKFNYGIMISASHNPYKDNGIKVLNAEGEKAEDDLIEAIEAFIDSPTKELPFSHNSHIGRVYDYSSACREYACFLTDALSLDKNKPFAGCKVGLDCANGSASSIAPGVFESLGAKVFVRAHEPDGQNINLNCGSTHIEGLQSFVKENKLDVGFAFDGDADRCLAVDEAGNLVDGDQIMYAAAVYLKENDRLASNTVVTTIMSNLGLYKALDKQNIAYEKTAVGDKYVYENMAANDHMIGGEQSGHIIFRQFATTGDGLLTSLMIMEMMLSKKKTLSELVSPVTIFPQVLKNVRVIDKTKAMEDECVKDSVQSAQDALGSNGRILVRKSGTEPVIRVMAEAADVQTCEQFVDSIIDVMRSRNLVVE